MSSDYLTLNQNYVQNGLGTLTFVVPATGLYNVKCQCTVPSAVATGQGGGSGRDLGLGATGGIEGIGSPLPPVTPGDGGLGQGFLGTGNDNATAFTAPAAVTSSLSIVVTDTTTTTTIYTSITPTATQSEIQFQTGFAAAAGDTITVVFSSSNANDKTLQAIKANVSLGQGLQ